MLEPADADDGGLNPAAVAVADVLVPRAPDEFVEKDLWMCAVDLFGEVTCCFVEDLDGR